jgi:hypothetical protein
MRRIIVFFWLVCGAGVILATAQRTEQPDASSCRRFAQQFYDWYAPLTQKEAATPSWDVALEQKSELFSAQLVKLLKADSLARSKAQGELVGLDFDPFVGGQDPADHYDVRRRHQLLCSGVEELPERHLGKVLKAGCCRRIVSWERELAFRQFPISSCEYRSVKDVGATPP